MKNKPKASLNKAKDVEAPKLKRIEIPNAAKSEINRMNQSFDNYIAGLAVGLGIKDKWNFDSRNLVFVVEDTDGKNKT